MSGKRPCTNLSIFGPAYPIAPFGLCTTGFVAGSAHNSVPPNPSPHAPNRIALTTANLDCHLPAHLKPVRNSLTLSPLLPPQSSTAAGPPPAPPPPPFVPLPASPPPRTRIKDNSLVPASAPPVCASIDLRPCGTRGCATHPRSWVKFVCPSLGFRLG
jgi:hypothetical protein